MIHSLSQRQKRIKRIQHILYNRNTMKLTLIE
ncbi:hypothetical protein M127_2491, partial [Bacteroides fragilis str. S6L5]